MEYGRHLNRTVVCACVRVCVRAEKKDKSKRNMRLLKYVLYLALPFFNMSFRL